MDRQRVTELAFAFVLGGGTVALGYELLGPASPDAPGVADAAAADRAANEDDAGVDDGGAVARGDDGMPRGDEGNEGDEPDEGDGGDEGDGEGGSPAPSGDAPAWLIADEQGSYTAFPPLFEPTPREFDDEAKAEYTKHGLVTSLAAIVRERADLESPIIGLLAAGTRVRVDDERTFGGGCTQGWNKVFPRGWICRSAGLDVGDNPPDSGGVRTSVRAKLDEALPYEYWRIKDEMTPFFHRLPSYEEQDRADKAGQAWYAKHSREPMPLDVSARPDDVPAVVREYMNAGYYVTKGGEEMKSQRRFIRTLRGAYARKYQLRIKESPAFQGKVLGGSEDLPIYFVRRELPLMKRESEGSDVLVESETIPERLSTHPFVDKIYIGNKIYFEDADGLLMRGYAVGKAYKLKRPPGVGSDEHWIHIDLSEQTLVAYDGDEPVFATLVSTGKEPGMTPVGVHRVQTKLVAASMRDQPQEDEAYSIDDVPWTQYFSGSVALHGAFWHAGFGQVRSHGCVNLSPSDARWLFGFTDPPLPEDWHAVAPTRGTPEGSAIVVTE